MLQWLLLFETIGVWCYVFFLCESVPLLMHLLLILTIQNSFALGFCVAMHLTEESTCTTTTTEEV